MPLKQLLVTLETASNALDMPIEVFVKDVLPALDVYNAGGMDFVRPDDLEELVLLAFGEEKEGIVVELFPFTDD